MHALLAVGCALLGLAVGSFLNVVIWRVPRKLSVVRPPSHCPSCEVPIRPSDNVPLLSWARLRGKCRHCQAPIPVRYPFVEAGCGALFAAAAVRFGPSWALPAYLVLSAALLAISVIDLEHYIVPDRITAPLTIVSIPLLGLASLGEGDGGAFLRALAGGVAFFVFFFLLNLAYSKGMGMGDVKLSFSLGLYLGWLGWGEVFLGGFLSFLLGAVIGLGLMAVRLRGRKDAVPFGPFLAAGTIITVLWGEPVIRWYWGA
jgi:leader peptidase (prepilin peptidase) / N-methyltransferase